METVMTAAANIEIFLASLGIAALIAFGALRAAFLLMGSARTAAGAGAGRHYTVRQSSISPELAFARARTAQGQGDSRIR